MLIQKVNQCISDKHLLNRHDRVLVALSGGADSVALLRVLLHEGYDCVAAHCNFHLRGAESDRDEGFVRALCERLSVPLEVVHFDTAAYAVQHNCSIEMAARELRYAWFEQVRQQTGASVIAVAHHKDDSVETFLLNLIRGTGIRGLRGITPVNGRIVRPMLEVSRAEILSYLQAIGQDYVTDSTNLETDFTRNKIRLKVLPLLGEINPSVSDAIFETASRLVDVEEVYRRAIQEACRRVSVSEREVSIPALLGETAPRAILFELYAPLGFNASQLDNIYRNLQVKGMSGQLFYSPEYVLLRNRDSLVLELREKPETALSLVVEAVDREELKADFSDRTKAFLDADKVTGTLTLRKWQSGDRFIPYGMKGYKKVRDYLRDGKFSLFEKQEQCVVCMGEEIVWLVNERCDQRFCVTAATRRVLVLSVRPAQ